MTDYRKKYLDSLDEQEKLLEELVKSKEDLRKAYEEIIEICNHPENLLYKLDNMPNLYI